MPRYWVLTMTEANAAIALRERTIGFGERSRSLCAKLTEGDLATFYLTRASSEEKAAPVQAFMGLVRVVGPMFESNDLLWPPRESEIFPWRRKIEVVLSKGRLPIRPLIGKLELITNDVYWALPLSNAARELSKHDFDLVRAGLEAAGAAKEPV